MRNRFAGLVGVAVLLFSSASPAVELSILGPSSIPHPLPGDSFVLDLALTNVSGDAVAGVNATITGLNSIGGTVVGGQSAAEHFVSLCVDGAPGFCVGGLQTISSAFFDPNDLTANYTPGDDSILIVNALYAGTGLGTTSQVGLLDPGLDGGLLVPSSRDVTLEILVPSFVGFGTLEIGGIWTDGTDTFDIDPVYLTLVVPEPGSATLLAIGLFGLASVRRSGRRGA